jgi:hypothetical protein
MHETKALSTGQIPRAGLPFAVLAAVLFVIQLSSPVALAQPTYPDKPPADPFQARLIPKNAKVYIAPIKPEDPDNLQAEGFENYLAAAMRKKNVPLLIVADRSQADFVIEGTANQKGPGWAKKIILQDFRKSTSASITVTNVRTGVVAYADSSDRASANRGLRSSAEKLAKYLKRKIENDAKKL